MPTINTSIYIQAPIQVCYDLKRDIDLHIKSTKQTKEKAIKGRTSGLMGLGDFVTWEATHFGVRQYLTVQMTEFEPPHRFVDIMVKGAFKSFHHEHTFESRDGGTWMTDRLHYISPFGPVGKLVDLLFLETYLKRLLVTRNRYIKEYAEKSYGI